MVMPHTTAVMLACNTVVHPQVFPHPLMYSDALVIINLLKNAWKINKKNMNGHMTQ
jgi:hypothetical protein